MAPKNKKNYNSLFRQLIFIVFLLHPFEIIGGSCNLIGSNWCDSLMNCTIFCFKLHLSPANEEATIKIKQPIKFQALFKVPNQIAGK